MHKTPLLHKCEKYRLECGRELLFEKRDKPDQSLRPCGKELMILDGKVIISVNSDNSEKKTNKTQGSHFLELQTDRVKSENALLSPLEPTPLSDPKEIPY